MTPTADATEFRAPDASPASSGAGRAVVQAAACYFMVILTLDWLLGPVRDFWERGGADPLLAVLCQAVASLLVLVWAAGWVVSAFGAPNRTGARLAVGFGAIGAVLVCDSLAGYLMFGITPLDFAAHFASAEGAAVGLSFLLAALLPSLRHRGRLS